MTTLLLRTWDLLGVPPGLTHDEASNAHDASGILDGQHAIYFPSGYGHEPLYDYSVALFTAFLGESIFTLRFTSVVWSLLTWSLTVALSRRWWGRRAAVITAFALTVSFWAQMMSRVGLRGPALSALFIASILFYDRAVHQNHRSVINYITSGLFLGACFYTYMASRGLPLVFILFLLSQLYLNRSIFKRIWRGTLLVILVAAIIGSPLFFYLRAHPDLELRVGQLGGAISEFFAGNWRPLLKNITDSLPIMLWQGDPQWLYNIGNRPALEPLLAVLFCCGVTIALVKFRHPRHILLLLCLGGGVAPALLTSVNYNTLHAIAAMPAAFLMVTLGLEKTLPYIETGINTLLNSLQGREHADGTTNDISLLPARKIILSRIIPTAIVIIIFVATGIESMRAYFMGWGQNRDVRVAYHHHVVSLGRELYRSELTSPVVITTLYPGKVHDPYAMDIALKDKNLPIHWVDGRYAVFIPPTPARLYIEEQTALHPGLWSMIKADVQQIAGLDFRAQDIPSKIEAYSWNSPVTWSKIKEAFKTDFRIRHAELASKPVNFGDVITFDGYHLTATSGDQLILWTAWSVTQTYKRDLNLFVHLLDESGEIVSQQDYLAAPSWQWETGDHILHQHHLTLPRNTDANDLIIAVGLYHQDDLVRLHVLDQSFDLDAILIPVEFTDI